MMTESEKQTRKNRIDVLLKEQGWDIANPTKVVLEVDTNHPRPKGRGVHSMNSVN